MKKGDICQVVLPIGVGSEQYGERPAIVVAQATRNFVIVIPLTSNRDALRFLHTFLISPTGSNGLKETSVALVFHLRSIAVSRVVKTLGRIDSKIKAKISHSTKTMLDL